jgi:hypothetical protein
VRRGGGCPAVPPPQAVAAEVSRMFSCTHLVHHSYGVCIWRAECHLPLGLGRPWGVHTQRGQRMTCVPVTPCSATAALGCDLSHSPGGHLCCLGRPQCIGITINALLVVGAMPCRFMRWLCPRRAEALSTLASQFCTGVPLVKARPQTVAVGPCPAACTGPQALVFRRASECVGCISTTLVAVPYSNK